MRIKRITKLNIDKPKRETEGSAGYDLRAAGGTYCLMPGERGLIETGFAWEIPEGMVGLIRPRSGKAVRYGLHVMAGVIDSDYRGEVKVLLKNLGDSPVEIKQGERIAQMVVTMFYGAELVEVDDLDDTERDEGGFGSTDMPASRKRQAL